MNGKSGYPLRQLGTIASIVGRTLNPQAFPTVDFAHYSIPAFDDGCRPVIQSGSQIMSNKTLIEPGLVLFSKLNPRINRVWITEAATGRRLICSTEFIPLKARLNIVSPEYLAWCLRSNAVTRKVRGQTIAATKSRERLLPSELLNLDFPLPPLPEQRRIVDILDRAASIQALRRQAQDTARLIIPALFNKMFGDPATNPMGWPVVRFRDVIDGFDGGKSMKADGDETGNARYYVLKLSAVTSGVFRSDEIKPAPDDYEPNPRHVIHNGDLLITRSNTAALVGASCLVADAPKNLLMPDLIWRVKVKQKSSVLPTFLLATLQHPQVRQRISALATGTSDSMRKLSQARLATLSVMIPPLSIQRTFDESASTLMRLRTRHEALALKEASMLASLQAGLLG